MPTAKVLAVQNGRVAVEWQRSSACGKCGLCSLRTDGQMRLWATNACNAQVGEFVVVHIDSHQGLQASVLAYGLPALCMCLLAAAGFGLGQAFWPAAADILTLAGILLGLAGGFAFARLWGRKNAAALTPVAIQVVPADMAEELCGLH